MKVDQCSWTKNSGWVPKLESMQNADWILVFGARVLLEDGDLLKEVNDRFSQSIIMGCSTAGEICGTSVLDDTVTMTAVVFECTDLKVEMLEMDAKKDSRVMGGELAKKLIGDKLKHILVISDGLTINGSDLALGLTESLPRNVSVSGGMAGDGADFAQTLIYCAGKIVNSGAIAIGFYGDRIQVGVGSRGGWDPFGPDRTITKAVSNVCYEVDGKPVLGLYKEYLGVDAVNLPASALMFPMEINTHLSNRRLVRTILNVSEEEQSMIFAGDIPLGATVRLMKANINRLADGALEAAKISKVNEAPKLALLISCVGRRLVMKQQVEDEIDAVREVLGDSTIFTGFYSYGEIAPAEVGEPAVLHNQTMTITTFDEV